MEQESIYVGIDVAKAQVDVALGSTYVSGRCAMQDENCGPPLTLRASGLGTRLRF